MKIRLAFQSAADERFLVTCESLRGSFAGSQGTFSITAFENENDFLQQFVIADLPQEDTISVVAAVLLIVSKNAAAPDWVPLTVTDAQFRRLNLRNASRSSSSGARSARDSREIADLREVMMQTPTPFVLLTGPEHVFTFVNPPYVELVRRSSAESLVGKPIREALPELKGQPYYGLLDNVYKTGEPYVGHAIPAVLRNDRTGKPEIMYFDFIQYPIRNHQGEVCGIMVQASDVTEAVMERQVRDAREDQLYKQWAELDTLYRYSPLALSLLDAKEFRILRLNDLSADLLGQKAEDLLGKSLLDLIPKMNELFEVLRRAATGEVVQNHELRVEWPQGSGFLMTFLLTCSPLFAEDGSVETVACVSADISERFAESADQGATSYKRQR